MTVIFIAFLHALPILGIAFKTNSKPLTWFTAVVMTIVAFMFGGGLYAMADMVGVILGLMLGLSWVSPADPRDADQQPTVQATLQTPPAPSDESSALGSFGSGVGLGFIFLAVIGGVLWIALAGPSKKAAPQAQQVPVTQPAQPSAMPQIEQPNSASNNTNQPSYNSPSAQSPQLEPKRQAASADSNKKSDRKNLKLYEATLRKLEVDHPELNPDLPGYREDLVRLILERIKVHERSGYPRHKALEMAAFDVGMDPVPTVATPIPVASKPPPKRPSIEDDPTYGLDKGNHTGFASNCRWVTSSVWSCQ